MTALTTLKTTSITLYKSHKNSVGYWKIYAEYHTDNSGRVEEEELDHAIDFSTSFGPLDAAPLGARIVIEHAKKEGDSPNQQIIEIKGKNIGRANETTPFKQAQLEMQSRINKQLDRGYTYNLPELGAKVVNALGKAQPMLATPLAKVKDHEIDWNHAYIQPKLDGHRGLFAKGLYSRGGKEINLPHIENAILELEFDELPLDGEIYCHGLSLQEIGSLIKRPRPESLQLAYYVYDLVLDVPYAERLRILTERLDKIISDAGVNCPLCLVHTEKVTSLEQAWAKHRYWVEQGFEGAILRHGVTGYEAGRRTKKLIKLKEYMGESGDDTEAEIVGVKQGTPYIRPNARYECAVFECKTPEGAIFECTAPGKMQDKHRYWVDRENYIGKQLTYKYFNLSAAGVPQQPVAIRIREDV
jgi:DNA ligase-1